MHILVVNSGSSSIKFSIFDAGQGSGSAGRPPWPRTLFTGEISGMGGAQLEFTFRDANGQEMGGPTKTKPAADPIDLLEDAVCGPGMPVIDAVGYRVVHPGAHLDRHQRITDQVLQDLEQAVAFAPLHDPAAIALIREMMKRFPQARHYACFDTVFHQTMPAEASTYPIPARYREQGVRRYGFHGLSYTYLMQELKRLGDGAASRGRVILAHLGSGASLAAVLDGRSIDTSMGFTPAAGLVMGTRSGDFDPGLASYLMLTESMSAAQFQIMVNEESGLLGISESSADVRDLLERETTDSRAREAIAIFCYQAKKWIGAYTAALGGLDTLVFAGGIGENAAAVRRRICDGLQCIGIELDDSLNDQHAARISTGRVAVRVIRTDEESVIANLTAQCVGLSTEK